MFSWKKKKPEYLDLFSLTHSLVPYGNSIMNWNSGCSSWNLSLLIKNPTPVAISLFYFFIFLQFLSMSHYSLLLLVHGDFRLFHCDFQSHYWQLYFLSPFPQDRILSVSYYSLDLLCSQIDFPFTLSEGHSIWKF